MNQPTFVAFLAVLASVRAQQVGTNTAEVHPVLDWEQCTASGCTTNDGSVVLDSNWRWTHTVSGYTNCYTGNEWDTTICPDPTTCAAACAIDGADYSGTYGVTTATNSITLDFVTGTNVGSRNYMLDSTGTKYEMFKLLNQEFTFDVDMSTLPCGLNGALYFSGMMADGGLSEYSGNKAGAAYGTGYCDSQCPQDLKWINGAANVDDWTPTSTNSGTGLYGSCCDELDIWEANSNDAALTPHPCTTTQQTECSGVACGAGANRYDGVCDHDGCDFNSYRLGNETFLGVGKIVDTSKVFTVVTQFITSDGTATGTLTEIRRIYVQDGVVIQNSMTDVTGITPTNAITSEFCTQEKAAFGDTDSFTADGGLAKMGKAMELGMVLVMSIWDDYAADMLWLDSVYPTDEDASTPGALRGPCATTSGVPATVEAASGSAKVTWSNIKIGDFNTTYTV